jgi:hypothetical protein
MTILDAMREKMDRDSIDALYPKEIKAAKRQRIFDNIIQTGILLVLLTTFLFSVWVFYTHTPTVNTHIQYEKSDLEESL